MNTEHEAYIEALQSIRKALETGSTRLSLINLFELEDLPQELTGLTGLRHLDLSDCVHIHNLSPLAGLTSLQHLRMSSCRGVHDLSPLVGLTDLQSLDLYGCGQIHDLQPLAGMTSLRHLDLGSCDHVHDLSPLAGLTNLQDLDLSDREWSGLDLSPLAGLTGLQHLDLHAWLAPDLSPLAGLTGLQHLDLHGCELLQDLSPLAGLAGLQYLDLHNCKLLQDLLPLAGLEGLQHLNLSYCKQLQDLSPLAGLTSLQHLALIQWEQLQDLSPLAGLTSLQYLDLCACGQLQDLSPLAGLMSLRFLDLSLYWGELRDLSPLAGLTGLQRLNVQDCEKLQDLSPLVGLTSLQQLDLNNSTKLTDLLPLAALTSLRHLNLSRCKQLQDLSPIAGLTRLQYLDLHECVLLQDLLPLGGLTDLQHLDLKNCTDLQDLSPIAGLTRLQYLDLHECVLLQDLLPLGGLTGLQHLDLKSCKKLQDLSPIAGLAGLQYLRLNECELLQDLSLLHGLRELKRVHLLNGSVLSCSPTTQPLASWSSLQELYANRLIGAPTELGSGAEYDNVLPRIRAWQADLLAGEASNSTVKLFVLGNGYVGKTQLCRRLRGDGFDSSILSTHGISLDQVQLADASGDYPAVTANVWDFGGQDVYLGTHALFLDERAIYVIGWTPGHENTEEWELNGVPMRNRPLAYWLEYVRSLAGPQAPVIVVQTQCDRELNVRQPPMPAEHGFERLRITSSSARQGDGMERLLLELKSAARFLLERYGKVRLPASWVAVGKELRTRINEKTLSRDEFDALCRAQHGASVPDVVLEYLHRNGQVFWRQGLFGNRLVLDLAWALDGVYGVLERDTSLAIIRRQDGRFSPHLLALLVWRNYGEQEQALFLSLMEQCQICFRVTDDVFIAPALLPNQAEKEGDIQQIWRGAVPDAVAHLDYPFLHEGVVMGMLCGLGREAGIHAVYWAYGVCFYDTNHRSTVRIFSALPDISGGKAGGSITVEAAGPGATPLIQHLVESIQRINIGRAPVITWEVGQPGQGSLTDGQTSTNEQQAFKVISPTLPPKLPDEPYPVYVSYAWGGESTALVDELERCFPADLKLKRDQNELRPIDWISRFMEEIGRADLVVVVLSDKYLRSRYCMRELLYLHQASLGKREHLMPRLVPLNVGKLPISDPEERSEIVGYWMNKHDVLAARLDRRGIACTGQADRDELLMLKDFQHRVSDILAWIADTIMPQQSELSEQRIGVVIDLLQQKAKKLYDRDSGSNLDQGQ